MKTNREIVLASSSAYRKALLQRIGLECTAIAPDIDETALPREAPQNTALRLARAKAQRIAQDRPAALIIGSDQVAVLNDTALGKPGTHDAAVRQLQAMSGQTVTFHTALCVLDAAAGNAQSANVPTTVRFRVLDRDRIERYLTIDRPYDCAGSAKIEALGIALVEKVESDDPSALIGLPLITLVTMLMRNGIEVL
ncbi:MAG: nucleoside triphosphate pyrophosphatase [Burkholderiales bacterium]